MTRINSLTSSEQRKLDALRTNLPYFAANFLTLTVMGEDGKFLPFKFNRSQMYLHEQIEKMKADTGRVRVIVPKGRKVGVSTYTGARFFHRTMFKRGMNTFIMAHDSTTTNELFKMVKDFYDRLPAPLRVPTKASNARKLIFDEIFSEYTVGTAGNVEVGRGTSPKNLHLSEAPFYPKGENIAAGALSAVPEKDDTEVVIEGTGNGMDAFFYPMAMAALRGEGQYRLIFIPWYWHPEHIAPVPADFKPDLEERELLEIYGPDGLTEGHLVFRRNKIVTFGGRAWKFKQEYPNNVVEAFQTSGSSLVPVERIMKARANTIVGDPSHRVVFGVDKGRNGPDPDRTVICARRMRKFDFKIYREGMTETQLAGIVGNLLLQFPGSIANIDVGDGTGCYDILCEQGFTDRVNAIYFGAAAFQPKVYANKRAEMGCDVRDMLVNSDCELPDSDEVHADFAAIPDYKNTSNGRIILMEKEKIKKDLGRSTDIFDAAMLTVAVPFNPLQEPLPPAKVDTNSKDAPRRSPLTSLTR